ncbi:hypothetical protein BN10_640014 [Phycicoccus elongatus Lp2]|uniref:Uncharacterized protein n=1 Tax=Phycicoccus elongatus Lp2 TaxID=1193181 RepID=N0E5U8_9MICO|nr:hypothetical protein BN10_640014 [Phycicoccus elongatus Lp2]
MRAGAFQGRSGRTDQKAGGSNPFGAARSSDHQFCVETETKTPHQHGGGPSVCRGAQPSPLTDRGSP